MQPDITSFRLPLTCRFASISRSWRLPALQIVGFARRLKQSCCPVRSSGANDRHSMVKVSLSAGRSCDRTKSETPSEFFPTIKKLPFFAAGKDPTATDASHIHRDPPDAATAQAKAGRYVRLFLRGTWFLLAEPRPLIDGAFPKQPLLTI